MNKPNLLTSLVFSILVGAAASVYAADEPQIYGSQLMTEQERNEHRNRMRNAANAEEREQIRKEHHERMRKRAAEQGIELPKDPPARGGKGMGPGGGMGGGQGSGMGGGMGKGNR